MNSNIISVENLSSGEITETKIKLKYKKQKFAKKGYKMYNNGVLALLDVLTKTEIKKVVLWYESANIGYCNILKKTFKDLTPELSVNERSKFKKKLIDGKVIVEYKRKIMFNPHVFLPREDKNIDSSIFLTQRTWTMLVEDKDLATEEIELFMNKIF